MSVCENNSKVSGFSKQKKTKGIILKSAEGALIWVKPMN